MSTFEQSLHNGTYAFDDCISPNWNKVEKLLGSYLISDYYDDKGKEFRFQNALCKFLVDKIETLIPSKSQTLQDFKQKSYRICKQNIGEVEFNSKYGKLESKFKSNMKLHFAKDMIRDGDYENRIASFLYAIYLKLSKSTAKNQNYITIYLNSFYNQRDISTLVHSKSLARLIDDLYSCIITYDYNNENIVLEDWLVLDNKGNPTTRTEEVYVIVNDENSIESIIEQHFKYQLKNETNSVNTNITF